jgi:hypothetical protein
LLSAFRRFVDRTSHALSQRYGPDSREAVTFKEAGSHEFDNEFAYRFVYHLRNYSDHRGSPISRIKQASRLTSNGQLERDFDVIFDSRLLLRNHRWHKDVREDLDRIDGEFSAVVIVDALLHSCGRIHCKTVLAQEVNIVAAIENIRILASETTPDIIFGPVFIQVRPREIVSRQMSSPINVTAIRTDLADVAEAALREAHLVIGILARCRRSQNFCLRYPSDYFPGSLRAAARFRREARVSGWSLPRTRCRSARTCSNNGMARFSSPACQ